MQVAFHYHSLSWVRIDNILFAVLIRNEFTSDLIFFALILNFLILHLTFRTCAFDEKKKKKKKKVVIIYGYRWFWQVNLNRESPTRRRDFISKEYSFFPLTSIILGLFFIIAIISDTLSQTLPSLLQILILRYHTNNLLVRHLYMLYVNELLYNLKIRKYITRKLEKKRNDYSSTCLLNFIKLCMLKGFLSYLFIFYLFDAPVSVQRTLLLRY